MLRLERLDPSDRDWKRVDLFDDRVIFQTREWIEFLAAGGGGEPVIAAVKDGPSWSTWHLGFNLRPGAPRHAAVEALMSFALNDLRCLHVEFRDRHFRAEDVRELGLDHTLTPIFEVDLSPPEEEIFARMTSA